MNKLEQVKHILKDVADAGMPLSNATVRDSIASQICALESAAIAAANKKLEEHDKTFDDFMKVFASFRREIRQILFENGKYVSFADTDEAIFINLRKMLAQAKAIQSRIDGLKVLTNEEIQRFQSRTSTAPEGHEFKPEDGTLLGGNLLFVDVKGLLNRQLLFIQSQLGKKQEGKK